MILAVSGRLRSLSLLVLPLGFACALVACGGKPPEESAIRPIWHVAQHHVARELLPAGSTPKLATLALPAVTWTGAHPEPSVRARLAVGVYADGSISFGDVVVRTGSAGVLAGADELASWWRAEHGPTARMVPGDASPQVEVHADRAASWDSVGSVLLFLARPPHGCTDFRLVAYREGTPGARVHLPLRVEQGMFRPDGELRVFIDEPGDLAWIEHLPPLPRDPFDDERYVWGEQRIMLHEARQGRAEGTASLLLAGVRVPTPARLEDETVVGRANHLWKVLAEGSVWRLRRFQGVRLQVWSPAWLEEPDSWEAAVPPGVPAAYPVQVIDLAHVDGLAVRVELGHRVYATFDPPARFAVPRPGAVLPPWVAVLCLLGVVLAFVSDFAGGRAALRRRAREDQTADA